MRRPVFLLLLILLQITLPVKLSGQKPDYRLFDNISLGTEASVINCFLQDTQGLIWIGSNKGLFSYDGYSTQPHFTFAKRNNTQIYCGTVVDSTYLYLGADNGLLVYNYRTDTYEEPETQLPTDIRALLVHDGMLWLGTLNGLYTYSLNDHQLSAVTEGIPHQTIYSLIRSSDGLLYIGTYNGFCRYIPATRHFEEIAGFFSVATGAISLSIPYWKIRRVAASGSVRKGVFSDIRLPTGVLRGLMLSTIIPSSHWHWMAVGSCWWVRTTVCMYIRKENLCCTWSTTPEICNHSPIISSGLSLPTGNITSGWVRTMAYPLPAILILIYSYPYGN